MRKLILITLSILLLSSFHSFSQSLDSLKLSANEIPEGYALSKKVQCKSIQAQLFFKNPDIYAALIGKVKKKDSQTFENRGDSGSILYFEFEKTFEQTGFLSGLLWGGDQPSEEHPEEFVVKNNVLIIYSLEMDSAIKKISKDKVSKFL